MAYIKSKYPEQEIINLRKQVKDLKKSNLDLRRSEKTNNTLYKISNAINITKNLDELFKIIHTILNDTISANNFFIALYHEKKDSITFPYFSDEKDETIYQELFNICNDKTSLTSRVIRKGITQLLKKKDIEGYFHKNNEKPLSIIPEIWLGVPLIMGNQILGAMVVQDYDNSEVYTHKDIDFLVSVSDQIAGAIEISSTSERLIVKDIELRTLFNISNAVNTTDNIGDLFKKIHQSLNKIIDAKIFTIAIYDSEKDIVSFPYYIDQIDEMYYVDQANNLGSEFYYSLNEVKGSMTGMVINSGKPVLMTKKKLIDYCEANGCKPSGKTPEVWLGVPLKIRNKTIGVMAVQNYDNPNQYNENDLNLLSSVSDQVALAINRKFSEVNLVQSSEKIENMSRQIEQFSLTAASIISLKEEKEILDIIIYSIIKFSDFNKVVISSFSDEPEYQKIICYGGISEKDIEELKNEKISKRIFINSIKKGEAIGRLSIYVSHNSQSRHMKSKSKSESENYPKKDILWHEDDKLYVKMIDEDGTLTGIISINDPKSGKKPTEETVRPLEIFSSLISQIILLKKTQAKLSETQKELIDKAHKAGMADIATDTIHNIGNTLNNLNTSAMKARSVLKQSNSFELMKANTILEENLSDIESFLLNNPKGKKLLEYYILIGKLLSDETIELTNNIDRIIEKAETIDHIIRSQQKYISAEKLSDNFSLKTIVEYVLNIHAELLEKNKIKVIRKYEKIEQIPVQRAKLISILINIIKNAINAMMSKSEKNRILTVHLKCQNNKNIVDISDTGHGIYKKNMHEVFLQGSMGKGNNTGISLHNCANYMAEMGGSIQAHSEGNNLGATFSLIFPMN